MGKWVTIVRVYKKLTYFYKQNPLLFLGIGSPPIIIAIIFFIFRKFRMYVFTKIVKVLLPTVPMSIFFFSLTFIALLIIFFILRQQKRKLSSQNKEVYLSLVNTARDVLQFETWEEWTSCVLSPSQQWNKSVLDKVENFRSKVFTCIWPGVLPELERAIKVLSDVMKDAVDVFLEHAESSGDYWCGVKFYHIKEWNPELYKKLSAEYDDWVERCDSLVFEATKAANWVADVVRRDLDQKFLATKGKLMLVSGPYEDLSYKRHIHEYTQKEKRGIPYKKIGDVTPKRGNIA